MSKLTLEQKVAKRKIKAPPKFIYKILALIWKATFFKRLNVNVEYKIDIKKLKAPFIVVSNHGSRVDYVYTGIPMLPHVMNYVAGYNEFFRSHLAFVFKLLNIIPKRNFTGDINTIKQITRRIRKKGKVIIFPEGMSSISGHSQPVALGSGKMLKHFGVPVVYFNLKGAYLSNTKHCLDERAGRVDVVVDMLFSSEQLNNMTADEIQSTLNDKLYHDDYEWNKTARVEFDGKGQMAKNFNDYIFICPKCHAEYSFVTDGDSFKCSNCGNGGTFNNYYDMIPFDDSCVIPDTPTQWWDAQRRYIYHNLILDDNFSLSQSAKIAVLPKYKTLKNLASGVIVGEGVITYNRQGFFYKGTRDGQPYEFHIPPEIIPSLVVITDMSFFQVYYKGEYIELYTSSPCMAKWLMAVEENHRYCGGKWTNYEWFDYNGYKF